MIDLESKIQRFSAKVQRLYPKEAGEILQTLNSGRPKTFRVNLLKVSEKTALESLKQEDFEFAESKIPNGYICTNETEEKRISMSMAAKNNQIYIQELSSMLPAIGLNPAKGESILDLCSAPGSKTGQIAIMTNNQAEIIAVEKGRDRFFKMRELLEKQGVSGAKTIMADANRLPSIFPQYIEYFDKVLLDAPCSNEGSIEFSHPSTIKFWNEKEAKKISKLQRGLLNTAVKLTKQGGEILYSTCTLSIEENEEVIDWILNRYPELDVLPLNDVSGLIEWSRDGFTDFGGKSYDKRIKNAVRVIPSKNFKGFFLCRIVKRSA